MKVAICTPSRGTPRPEFLACVDALDFAGFDVCKFDSVGKLLENRNSLTRNALDWGAEAILWLDDDHVFPPDTLQRLAGHGKDVTGCNYARKRDPSRPTAQRFGRVGERERVWTSPADAKEGRLDLVSDLGLGVCLVRRGVHERVRDPYFAFATTKSGLPVGEDYFFCERALGEGLSIWLDHGLSWEVGHVDDNGFVYTNLKAWMDRPRFLLMEAQGLVPVPDARTLQNYR